MRVSDLIARIRLVGIDYDVKFAENDHYLAEIHDIELETLALILDMGVSSYPLPQDATAELDVSAYDEFYELPSEFWRARRIMLSVTKPAARPIPVQLVTPEHGAAVPFIHPSAYIERAEGGEGVVTGLFPVDGVAPGGDEGDRIFGWQEATTAVVKWIPAPSQNKTPESDLSIPDDAVPYAALLTARWAAKRGRSSDSTVQQVARDLQRAEQILRATVQGHAGAGYRGA